MFGEFSDEGNVDLDLSDELNSDAISFLRETYDEEGYLLNSFFRIFQILGIDDRLLIGNLMKDI